MPRENSKWIIFIPDADAVPKNWVFETFRGAAGRLQYSRKNLDRTLDEIGQFQPDRHFDGEARQKLYTEIETWNLPALKTVPEATEAKVSWFAHDSSLDEWLADPRKRTHHQPFSSSAWKSQHNRAGMVGDLVWSYPLIGMKREKVYDLMGAGSEGSGVPNRESYDLGEKHIAMCGNAIDYYGLIVNYNDQSELQSLQLRHMGLTFPVQVSSTITVNPGSDTKPDTMHSGTASTETGDQ